MEENDDLIAFLLFYLGFLLFFLQALSYCSSHPHAERKTDLSHSLSLSAGFPRFTCLRVSGTKRRIYGSTCLLPLLFDQFSCLSLTISSVQSIICVMAEIKLLQTQRVKKERRLTKNTEGPFFSLLSQQLPTDRSERKSECDITPCKEREIEREREREVKERKIGKREIFCSPFFSFGLPASADISAMADFTTTL